MVVIQLHQLIAYTPIALKYINNQKMRHLFKCLIFLNTRMQTKNYEIFSCRCIRKF